ncbi:MAG: LamG-like jellyroll fold domain-containing protein, partial [Terracidiphilus sp.]
MPRTADGTPQSILSFGNPSGDYCRIRAKSGAGNTWMVQSGIEQNLKPGPLCGSNMHVVAIWDPPGNQLCLYINGLLEIYGPYGGTTLLGNTGPNDLVNYIGANINGGEPVGGGATMQELRLYNGALSPIQVRTSLAAGPGNP